MSPRNLGLSWLAVLALFLQALHGLAASGATKQTPDDVPTLQLRAGKARAYVHESIPLTVTLIVEAGSARNIQHPRLGNTTLGTVEFDPPRQDHVIRDGGEFLAYEFSGTLRPEQTGELRLGPAELRFDLFSPTTGAGSFFGGREPRAVTLQSEPVTLSILPPPAHGRPEGYGGAVGRFTLSRNVAPTTVQVGDPVTVTTRIKGIGNIDSIACPTVSLPGVRAYPPSVRRTAGRLSCEQVMVINTAVPITIPPARISFFDPRRARYESIETAPVDLQAATGPDVTDVAPALAPSSARVSPSSSTPALPWVAAALASMLATALVLASRTLRLGSMAHETVSPPRQAVAYWITEAERSLAAGKGPSFHAAVFRALQSHLAVRHGLEAPAITADVVANSMRPAGTDERTIDACIEIFRRCDLARYGPDWTTPPPMEDTMRLLRTLVGDGTALSPAIGKQLPQ